MAKQTAADIERETRRRAGLTRAILVAFEVAMEDGGSREVAAETIDLPELATAHERASKERSTIVQFEDGEVYEVAVVVSRRVDMEVK